MKAVLLFPGQGAQSVGMGKELYENNAAVRAMFERANELLGFRITDLMFEGTPESLKETRVTQPAVFLHSVAMAVALGGEPEAVAGHSLGEFSALVVAGALSFEEGLLLVAKRARAMQEACDRIEGTMAAILALSDSEVERVCAETEGVVVAANYNCPGQLVISGEKEATITSHKDESNKLIFSSYKKSNSLSCLLYFSLFAQHEFRIKWFSVLKHHKYYSCHFPSQSDYRSAGTFICFLASIVFYQTPVACLFR